jgi:hypothetical protein
MRTKPLEAVDVRSRELAARVRQRFGDQSLFVTLCYLQLAADVGI